MIACIVQARMGSTRFPGKALYPLDGKPVIQRVVERCQEIPGIAAVVVATSTRPNNKPLLSFCEEQGVVAMSFPDERDVLKRYCNCAAEIEATVVMRVTGDCPLIDPALCGQVLQRLQEGHFSFAANDYPVQTYATGLGCEVFTMSALDTANRLATSKYDREHVSPWMQRNLRVGCVSQDKNESSINLCVDYPHDIERLEAIIRSRALAQ